MSNIEQGIRNLELLPNRKPHCVILWMRIITGDLLR